jgi:hypothetical protein
MLIAEAQVSLNSNLMQERIGSNFKILSTSFIFKNFSLRYWYLSEIDLAWIT